MSSSKNNSCCEIWVTAGFRATREHEAYLFMKKECALYYYIDGTRQDKVLRGPDPIVRVFPSLKCTIFGDAGIDCAFGTSTPGKAYIFSYDQCAEFKFADYGGDDMITKSTRPISQMFPDLPTRFLSGIDAAFETYNRQEAYLFKDNLCARIDNRSDTPRLIGLNPIRDVFPILRGTDFENGGFDAAFTLHYAPMNHAVIYKGNRFCHIGYQPGSPNNQVKYGPYNIKDQRVNLGKILPRNNATLANLNAN